MEKPLLIFDGDCGFCRIWIARWKRFTHGKVDYAASQDVGKDFPDIPPEEFQKAVQLIEPDGRRSSAAEAVFRALRYGGSPVWLWMYEHLPGFAPLAEFFYGIVAGHRPTFSTFTRWFWGNPAEPVSCRHVRWVFLRSLAVMYGVAFWSFGVQSKGLIGSGGIFPAAQFLSHLSSYGAAKFWYVPTLAWFNASDRFLAGLCAAGAVASFLIFFNVAPRLFLFVSWLLYLSMVSVGGDFMNFQWDALLLEAGFLAIFLAPSGLFPQFRGARSPAPAVLFLLRWLLFRLMFQSALVKWLSGDSLWHHFTALTVHYQTQPLPSPLSWYVHQLPVWFHKVSCAGMFLAEGFVPFFIFAPRRLRTLAFWPLAGFQVLIFITGNYAYFNWLAIALCLPLSDDAALRRFLPSWCDEPLAPPPARQGMMLPLWGHKILIGSVIYLTVIPFGHILRIPWSSMLEFPNLVLSPMRSFNSYGLFAVMTPRRPEIIVEGSDDQKIWKAYEFKYKPRDPARRPSQVAPYQPRLDWQMWFAALGDYRQNPWFINFCVRLLEGSKPVNALLAFNPFMDKPPRYVRAMLYDYGFTNSEERRKTGHGWVREALGVYCPVLALKPR